MANCDHGVMFDKAEADKILARWSAMTPVEFVAGNPAAAEIRKRWPRLHGPCPKGCGFTGIAYASMAHYAAGDW